MEMNVGMLREIIKDLRADTPVFVACQGYCNYDFKDNKPCDKTDTFAIEYDGKLFMMDTNAVQIDKSGNTI